jgi:hypothetical protein
MPYGENDEYYQRILAMSIGDHPNPQGYPPTMTIGRPRKDGKYPVKLNYPTAGRTFRKLFDEGQVRELLDTDRYRVVWDYPHIARFFLDS